MHVIQMVSVQQPLISHALGIRAIDLCTLTDHGMMPSLAHCITDGATGDVYSSVTVYNHTRCLYQHLGNNTCSAWHLPLLSKYNMWRCHVLVQRSLKCVNKGVHSTPGFGGQTDESVRKPGPCALQDNVPPWSWWAGRDWNFGKKNLEAGSNLAFLNAKYIWRARLISALLSPAIECIFCDHWDGAEDRMSRYHQCMSRLVSRSACWSQSSFT